MWNALKSALGFAPSGPPDSPEVAAAKVQMATDHLDPRKRFVWCALAISADEPADPGHRAAYSTTALTEWYGMGSRDELLGNLDFYFKGTGSTPAYDAFRGIFMARAGAGANMLSDQESWEQAYRFVRKMKQAYPSWNHYGSDYVEGHIRHRQKEGDSDEHLVKVRRNMLEHFGRVARGLWTSTPYETPV